MQFKIKSRTDNCREGVSFTVQAEDEDHARKIAIEEWGTAHWDIIDIVPTRQGWHEHDLLLYGFTATKNGLRIDPVTMFTESSE